MKNACLIGRSKKLSDEDVQELFKKVPKYSLFNEQKPDGDGDTPLIVDWLVTSPVMLYGLDLPAKGEFGLTSVCGRNALGFDKPTETLTDIGVDGFISYDIEVPIVLNRSSFKSRFILHHGGRGLVRGYGLWLHSRSNKCEPSQVEEFLTFVLSAFELSHVVKLFVKDGCVRFKLDCDMPEVSAIKMNYYGPGSDIADEMVGLSGLDLDRARRCCDRIMSHSSSNQIRFNEYACRVSSPADLQSSASWMTKFYQGPWLQRYCGYGTLRVTGGDVLEKLHQNEVIPLGLLGAKKKVKGLGRNGVYVDLFKEGDGWHVAFHYKEQEAGPRQRSASIEAIHDLLGMKLIEKTPETLWPHIFH